MPGFARQGDDLPGGEGGREAIRSPVGQRRRNTERTSNPKFPVREARRNSGVLSTNILKVGVFMKVLGEESALLKGKIELIVGVTGRRWGIKYFIYKLRLPG